MERMTSLELVALTAHVTWCGRALPTELHPQKVQDEPSASTEVVLRQVVKELPPSLNSVGGAIHRSQVCADAQAG